MVINKKPLKRRRLKTNYTKSKTNYYRKNKKKNNLLKIVIWIILLFLTLLIIISAFLYKKYISDLPSVSELENLEIAESSIIYDREGGELYKIFKEKRTYVPFQKINKNMINAIVAIEDKRYWTNPGVDIKGLVRAGINFIIGSSDSVKGTSTLTQQLIRNTIIKNEKSLERKIKEIYLAYKITKGVSKEKILELYLNKISYGHNAFGIEEASKTFFNKSSENIGILESTILASLPKGPTYYSPYNHPDRVVGYPYIYTSDNPEEKIKIITKKDIILNKDLVNKFIDFIKDLKISRLEGTPKTLICNLKKEYFKTELRVDNDGCSVIEYSELIPLLNGIRIKQDKNFIEYETGRKDRVLGRMLEDKYINFDEYKKALIDGIGMDFSQSKENIKAPHFVFYVKEYLEEKYGKEVVSIGGLKIYTTLDPKLQKKAEELVEKQSKINTKKYNAKNAALISLDNKTGEILAMVGGKDYFDKENKGNVNIITSKLQPGSTFKPFVYSLAILNKQIGSKTPIYDLKTNFPGYSPSNFDGIFMGKMNISTALNNSRNIPAIKMFYLSGGEKIIVDFMKKIGANSLKSHGQYGAPLALGTGEMTPLELATSYSTYANLGIKKEITPILKIEDNKGNIIEEKEKIKEKKVMSPAQAYITNYILSDSETRPAFWNTYMTIPGRKMASKTGTSTKQYIKKGVKDIFPSNLWTIGYTPQITTVVWAGNTTGEKLYRNGSGLEGAGPILKGFMAFAHKGKKVENWRNPGGVKQIKISEVSGLLPNPEINNSLLINSLFINTPTKYDDSFIEIEVDKLCNGKVTNSTPTAAIQKATLLKLNSLNPSNPSWQKPVEKWTKSDKFKEKYGNIENILGNYNDKICKRSGIESDIKIRTTIENNSIFIAGINHVELAYRSNNPIISIQILIGNTIVDEVKIENKKNGSYVGDIFIPASYINKRKTLTLRAVDSEYYSSDVSREIIIAKNDNKAPEIRLINPSDSKIKLYNTDFFNLKATIKEAVGIKTINIKIDNKLVETGLKNKNIIFEVNKARDLSIGKHIITIEAIDTSFNKSSENIILEILAK